MPELQSLVETPGVFWQRADQCMYGLVTPDDDGIDTPAKKPTGFLSTSWCILEELSLVCDSSHRHQHLMSGRAAAAALYPPQLCKAICRGLAKQRSYDDSGLVGGQRFGRKEIKALLNKLNSRIADNNGIDNIHTYDDKYGSQEASSHLADEPGGGETHDNTPD